VHISNQGEPNPRFEPFEPDELPDDYDALPWDDEDTFAAVEWLFKTPARMRLVLFALQELHEGDPIFMNKSELGDAIDKHRQSAQREIDALVEMGVYEEREEGYTRYRPRAESNILRALAPLEKQVRAQYEY